MILASPLLSRSSRQLEAAAGLGADAVILQHAGICLGVSPAPQGLTLHDHRIPLGLAIAIEERWPEPPRALPSPRGEAPKE